MSDSLNENMLVTSHPIAMRSEAVVLLLEILAQFLFMQKEVLNEYIARVKVRKNE